MGVVGNKKRRRRRRSGGLEIRELINMHGHGKQGMLLLVGGGGASSSTGITNTLQLMRHIQAGITSTDEGV